MKNPLNYQTTEYDCGPTTMINAFSFLYRREEISPDIIKCIMQYCLDAYNRKGEACKSGTTDMAMMFLAQWLNQYGRVKKFPIWCENLTGEQVYLGSTSKVTECLYQKGVVVAKVMLGCWHYVLLTGIEGDYICLFDPYFRQRPYRKDGVEMIWDQPKRCNRKVRIDILNDAGRHDYALGKIDSRECVLMFNTQTRQTMDQIEYII
jgi:hypothetical protein